MIDKSRYFPKNAKIGSVTPLDKKNQTNSKSQITNPPKP